MTSVLAARGVVKRFGEVAALSGADLELRAGEIHGVLGENGAGKTTLLHVLGGVVRPDDGSLTRDGRPWWPRTPADAWRDGVGLVHQHFTLVPRLSVIENLALGSATGSGRGRLDPVRADARRWMDATGLDVPLDAQAGELGVGDRQRAEILKALLRDPAVLAMDEPTAVLTPGEVDALFDLLRKLRDQGRAVALVAHKLDEVLGVADRVSVLREGRTVLTAARDEVDAEELARAMVGESGKAQHHAFRAGHDHARDPRLPPEPAIIARLRDVSAGGDARDRVEAVSLEARGGRIVGVAGVEGNGQRRLARLLAGRETPTQGQAEVPGEPGFIPQDRTREGVVASLDLTGNIALALHRDPAFRRGPFLRWGALRDRAAELGQRFDIRASSLDAPAGALSGGNQQRLVVAREMAGGPSLLVAENPTRGLDAASAAFVHGEIRAAASAGAAVVLISTDLDEVLTLSDRVMVMVRGRLVAVPAEATTRAGIGALMLSAAHG